MYHFNELFHYNYRSDLVIPGTKSSLHVEEIFEFSDILYGTILPTRDTGVPNLIIPPTGVTMVFLF